MYDLTPEEILNLSKIQGRRVDDTAYSNEITDKFCSYGLLCIGTAVQSLEYSDMATIRELLKEKGLKAGGKKVDLVQRVLQNYSDIELECAEVPRRFILTEAGNNLLIKMILYYFILLILAIQIYSIQSRLFQLNVPIQMKINLIF